MYIIDCRYYYVFFFFNDTATTEIYTLSLHDALPIWSRPSHRQMNASAAAAGGNLSTVPSRCGISISSLLEARSSLFRDRKSTRLNSSHANISYAVFCLKKKKKTNINYQYTIFF